MLFRSAHSIEARDLFNAVLIDINRFADMAVSDEKAVRAIEKRLTETDQSKAKALEKEQRKLNKRLAELDRLFSSLYEDKVMERITERNFEMMSGKYQKEQLEIEARLKEVMETLNDSYEKSQGVRDFLSLIRNYQGIKELDATIINALIDKILVSEREKLTDGTVRQEIKIYYKFIGFVGELHITPTKRWTALKPKNCTVCGVEYVPCSAISKYCPECRKKIRKVRGTETKRRSRERNRQACIELSAKNDRLMRVSEMSSWVSIWGPDTLGATAITMPLGELYGALQNGTAEASEGPYEQLATNKFYEVQDYVINTNHVYEWVAVFISEKTYQKLPEDLQDILSEYAVSSFGDYCTELNQETADSYLQELVDNGMEVIEPDREAFQEKALSSYDKWFADEWTVTDYDEVMSYAK